ncbi:MAG: hypothetical protein IIB57_02865 [Planctomycetes bacterium]|nr:hypothetical protein [Planctomycetota bacterium]
MENNIWRRLTESTKGKEFIPLEWFLLSCAACSHDFDKGLKSARPEGAHGVASGRFVHKHRDKLGVDATEAIAIDYLNSIHDYRGTQFVEELEKDDEK